MWRLELLDHLPDEVLDMGHLALNVFDLWFFYVCLILHFFDFFDQIFSCLVLFSFTFSWESHVELDLYWNLLVLFFNHVYVGIQHVNVVVKWVVLLFGLNKSGNNFLDTADTSRLFNLFECIFYDLNISCVHFHQTALLLIVCNPTVKSGLKKSCWVWKFHCTCGVSLFTWTFSTGLVKFIIISFL